MEQPGLTPQVRLLLRRKSRAWLVVEDDAGLRGMLAAMITLWGRTPLAFEDGFTALDWLNDLECGKMRTPIPQLALLDISMRGPSGLDVAERLRASAETRSLPIIIFTAMVLDDTLNERIAKLGGTVRVIPKPVPSMKLLRQTLEEVIGEPSNGTSPLLDRRSSSANASAAH
jgi:CheY-like chemotaxis protein